MSDSLALTITPSAAAQIAHAAADTRMHGLALRIAAQQKPDGSLDYRMGFDERHLDDHVVACGAIEVVITETEAALLQGAVLDFVEIEPGESRFIFMNPNDAHYSPPSEG